MSKLFLFLKIHILLVIIKQNSNIVYKKYIDESLLMITECSDGNYGLECSQTCHCASPDVCDKRTGRCPNGCSAGYLGDNCDQGMAINICQVSMCQL